MGSDYAYAGSGNAPHSPPEAPGEPFRSARHPPLWACQVGYDWIDVGKNFFRNSDKPFAAINRSTNLKQLLVNILDSGKHFELSLWNDTNVLPFSFDAVLVALCMLANLKVRKAW